MEGQKNMRVDCSLMQENKDCQLWLSSTHISLPNSILITVHATYSLGCGHPAAFLLLGSLKATRF